MLLKAELRRGKTGRLNYLIRFEIDNNRVLKDASIGVGSKGFEEHTMSNIMTKLQFPLVLGTGIPRKSTFSAGLRTSGGDFSELPRS